MKIIPLLFISFITLITNNAIAMDSWFVRPYFGTSQISDLSTSYYDINGLSGNAEIDLSNGFTSGLGIGYHFNKNYAAELGWEYRSNDSSAILSGTSQFESGDYASNIFYLNGHYLLSKRGQWQAYIGAGATWVQEIDIDLESQGTELSYSGSGDIGYQVFAGLNYDLNKRWAIQSEIRYGSISDIDIKAEGGNAGGFKDLDYDTTTFQLGVVFNF